MDLLHSEIDDLESIALDDAFIAENLNTPFDEETSRQTLQDVCTSFVQTFLLGEGEWVSSLHHCLKECVTVLEGMETVLEQFIEQLGGIRKDIGDVRETLVRTATQLMNAKVADRVLWTAVSRLVVPPEVVQVVTQSNEEELGTQFALTLRELLKYLNYRKGTWQLAQTVERLTGAMRHSTEGALADGAQRVALESTRDDVTAAEAAAEVHLSMKDCAIYNELLNVLDSLTVYACIKVRDFLHRKLQILTIPSTNVCIQQENALKQHGFYVHFLRAAPPLLRHAHARGPEGEKQPTLIPFRIARAIYIEFKQQYCQLMGSVYRDKIQEYLFTCNAMEYSTTAVSSAAAAALTSVGSSSLGAVGGTLLGGFGRGNTAPPSDYTYGIPLLTDVAAAVAPSSRGVFALRSRGLIFRDVFAAPLVPAMEKVANRRHSYEETFRSLLFLLSDAVTHEYLFTFEFFSGDMSVYTNVFAPTLQFVVDYVSEVILTQSSGTVSQMLSQLPDLSLNHRAKSDCYGLLILIRLCHEYKAMMRSVRKLSCLDALFESLLLLLWPVFKKTFDAQLIALRCTPVASLVPAAASRSAVEAFIATVHPLVENFTQMSCEMLGICMGTAVSEAQLLNTHGGPNASSVDLHRDLKTGSASASTSTSSSPHASEGSEGYNRSTIFDMGQGADEELHRRAAGGSGDTLRRLAMARMAQEDDADISESNNRFTALMGSIDFLRVEIFHRVEQVACIVLTRGSLRPLQSTAEQVMKDAYLLNNLHYMLVEPQNFYLPGEEGQRGGLLTEWCSFKDLEDTYEKCQVRLAEELLALYFDGVSAVVCGDDDATPSQLIDAAEGFLHSWRTSLDAMRERVVQLMYNAALAKEVIAKTCMECLLYNTRFMEILSSAVAETPQAFVQRPTRSLVVSNQTILQHMRTFSAHIDPSDVY